MRYLVTGGSGYIGTRLVDRLAERDETERVVIADIRPPASFRPKASYERLDVRDAAGARALLERERDRLLGAPVRHARQSSEASWPGPLHSVRAVG